MKPIKMILALTMLVMAMFAPPAGAVLLAAGSAATLASSMGVGLRAGVMMTISAAALNSAYGSYFADGGERKSLLYKQVFHESKFDKLFTLKRTKETRWRASTVTMGSITQPFQKAFTPSGTVTLGPAEIPLYKIKVDLSETSYDIYNTWIGEMHEQGKEPSAQAFMLYIINELVLQQHNEDIELEGAFNGVFATPTPGTPGAVGTMIQGLRKTINDAITASTIDPIVLGAVPTDAVDFCTYVEDFVKGIDAKNRRRPMTLAMNEANAQLFREGNRAKYSHNYKASEDLSKVFHFENITVDGFVAMGDSEKMFCTIAGNAVKPYNPGTGNLVNFENEDRKLKIWLDHDIGYGFVRHDYVYTNDADLS